MDDDSRFKLVIFGISMAFFFILFLLMDVIEATVKLFFPGLSIALMLLMYANYKKWLKFNIPDKPDLYIDAKGLSPRDKNIAVAGAKIAIKCVDGYESTAQKLEHAIQHWKYSDREYFKNEMVYYRIMVFYHFISERLKNQPHHDMNMLIRGANEIFGQKMGVAKAELIYEKLQNLKGNEIPNKHTVSILLEDAQLPQYQSDHMQKLLYDYLLVDTVAHLQYANETICPIFDFNHH